MTPTPHHLQNKFQLFTTDSRWPNKPELQRYLLKGLELSTRDDGICLCLSHLTICVRLDKATTNLSSPIVLYCSLTDTQAQDCAEGMIWYDETRGNVCGGLDLYAETLGNNHLNPTAELYKSAASVVNTIHANFETMSIAVSTTGPEVDL